MEFKLHAPYKPTGDQPRAIEKLVQGFEEGNQFETLVGVTGSGKTFTMANIIQYVQKPPVEVLDEHLMFKIIRASFNQRRKTMMNSVGNSGEVNVSKEELLKALEQCGFSATIRGEALTLEQFAALTNAIINNR